MTGRAIRREARALDEARMAAAQFEEWWWRLRYLAMPRVVVPSRLPYVTGHTIGMQIAAQIRGR